MPWHSLWVGRGSDAAVRWASWPLFATQQLLAIEHFSAFVAKVGASGTSWANGSTLHYLAYVEGLTHGYTLDEDAVRIPQVGQALLCLDAGPTAERPQLPSPEELALLEQLGYVR